ncbi:hypothetical protein C8R44DRAFT_825975, partial [Mycena epipterygia]
MPPLYLVALWDYFERCEDFEERITFAVFQRLHLFLPEIVKPVQELLAEWFPEKARRAFALHNKLFEDNPVVDCEYSLYAAQGMTPLWQKMEDMIHSLARFADRSFPPIEPIFWFDMVQVLGGQYQSQDEGTEPSWRPSASLAVAYKLSDRVFGEEVPPLNLDLLPEYVQCAVKQFCQTTEGDDHTCYDDDATDTTWANLPVEYRTR